MLPNVSMVYDGTLSLLHNVARNLGELQNETCGYRTYDLLPNVIGGVRGEKQGV